ncbi:MAG: type II 3-dehydroquinate dehydratase [Spirochaetes bacterium]|nr:type II 3-dehydroquinate dehydratase [Spirochaetota bacterium]MBX3722517.1 type II 3-dehydroquinate dehydratase [Turneriella sp.]
MRLFVVNGPNLNLLGRRESGFYGTFSLADLETKIRGHVGDRAELAFFQSNNEGEIIGYLQNLKESDRLILNAASLTHTSIGIRDALAAVKVPFVEVHISNVYAREEFRHKSYLSAIAAGVIVGLGAEGYLLAADYFLRAGTGQ